jgi:uncharacterized protein YndB with AHSA1/START domain
MGIPVAATRVHEEALCEQPPAEVWAVLDDLRGYDSWWPWFVRVRSDAPRLVGGATFTVRPVIGYEFTCAVEAVEPPNRLVLRFREGPFAGRATWTLTPEDGGTLIDVSADITSTDRVLGVVGQVIDVGAGHAIIIRGALDGLSRALDARTRWLGRTLPRATPGAP